MTKVKLYASGGILISEATNTQGVFTVTTPDTYTIVCSYDGITSAACQKSVTLGGYCKDLSAQLVTGQTYTFTCAGE